MRIGDRVKLVGAAEQRVEAADGVVDLVCGNVILGSHISGWAVCACGECESGVVGEQRPMCPKRAFVGFDEILPFGEPKLPKEVEREEREPFELGAEDAVVRSVESGAEMVEADDLGVDPKGVAGALKAPLHLVPSTALYEVAKVLKLGAEKYGEFNWRENKVQLMTYVGAIQRHLQQAVDGEDADAESGRSHFAHIMASCAIVLDAARCGMLGDNRPPSPEVVKRMQRVEAHNAKALEDFKRVAGECGPIARSSADAVGVAEVTVDIEEDG